MVHDETVAINESIKDVGSLPLGSWDTKYLISISAGSECVNKGKEGGWEEDGCIRLALISGVSVWGILSCHSVSEFSSL